MLQVKPGAGAAILVAEDGAEHNDPEEFAVVVTVHERVELFPAS